MATALGAMSCPVPRSLLGHGLASALSPRRVARDGAVGNEADLWQNGRSANVLRALTLVPNAFREWREVASAQYLSFQDMAHFDQPPNRSLHRMQIELVAGRVSAINECFY